MRKILILSLAAALVGAAAAAWFLGLPALRFARAVSFTSSVVSADLPIAELATRKVVWRVVSAESTASVDTFRETVYTLKAGYDLAAIEEISVDRAAMTVTLSLPPPRILSIDDALQRSQVRRKSFFERVFGADVDDGAAERKDLARLAEDCEKYGLLSTADLRESIVKTLAKELEDLCGYRLVVKDGRDVPATVLFNAYFEEKGVGLRL